MKCTLVDHFIRIMDMHGDDSRKIQHDHAQTDKDNGQALPGCKKIFEITGCNGSTSGGKDQSVDEMTPQPYTAKQQYGENHLQQLQRL